MTGRGLPRRTRCHYGAPVSRAAAPRSPRGATAVAFAGCGALLAAAGHTVAGGALPAPELLVLAAVLVAGLMLLPPAVTATGWLAAAVGSQLLFHVAAGAPLPGHGLGHGIGHGTAAGGTAMLLAHTVAALATVALCLLGHRVAGLVAAFVRRLLVLVSVPVPAPRRPAAPAPLRAVRRPVGLLLAVRHPLRGPPAVVVPA